MDELLRAGVIGLGAMGRNHVRVLSSLEGVHLVGVADPLGDRFDAARDVPVLDTLDALLELALDCCVVAVPTEDHEPLALQLAGAGVHTLVEKPLAENLLAAQKVVDAFDQAGLVGAVGHIERFNPALLALRERLEAGEIGEVFQISTSRQGPFPARIRDVGVVKDLATHDIDLAAWVGRGVFASVSAYTAHKAGRPHEDLLAAAGRLDNGIITSHLVNWLSPAKERRTVVLGETGTFVADTLTADLTFHANGTQPLEWEAISKFRGVTEGDVVRFAIPKPEPLRSELEAFRDAILGKASNIVTMQDGLEAVRVAEALLQSAQNGQAVRISRQRHPR